MAEHIFCAWYWWEPRKCFFMKSKLTNVNTRINLQIIGRSHWSVMLTMFLTYIKTFLKLSYVSKKIFLLEVYGHKVNLHRVYRLIKSSDLQIANSAEKCYKICIFRDTKVKWHFRFGNINWRVTKWWTFFCVEGCECFYLFNLAKRINFYMECKVANRKKN